MPRWPTCPKFTDAKLCQRCNTVKPWSEFGKNNRNSDGKYSYCKSCKAADDQKRHAESYKTVTGRARVLHRNAYIRKPDGFTLTIDHIVKGIERGFCIVTGIAFDLSDDHQTIADRFRSPYAPSVDKINPHLPYTNENTRIVIWQYNSFKGELTDQEVLFICKRVVLRNAL